MRSNLPGESLLGPREVPIAKIAGYLLNPDHPRGGAKARFFLSLGFSRSQPDVLVAALLRHADEHPVHDERTHDDGVNRELRCRIVAPDGREPCIRVIWFQPHGGIAQRLVTAYPV